MCIRDSFYWDQNDATRAWSKRFAALASKNSMPSMTQAGNYAMVLHYLKAMEALGGNPHDGAKVVAKMKELPTDDPLFGKGPLRALAEQGIVGRQFLHLGDDLGAVMRIAAERFHRLE